MRTAPSYRCCFSRDSPATCAPARPARPPASPGRWLRRRMFPGAVLPVGYSDSVFGYLPTTTMLGQRGYEDSGFMRPFGLAGQFRPELERVVLDAWERLTR